MCFALQNREKQEKHKINWQYKHQQVEWSNYSYVWVTSVFNIYNVHLHQLIQFNTPWTCGEVDLNAEMTLNISDANDSQVKTVWMFRK